MLSSLTNRRDQGTAQCGIARLGAYKKVFSWPCTERYVVLTTAKVKLDLMRRDSRQFVTH